MLATSAHVPNLVQIRPGASGQIVKYKQVFSYFLLIFTLLGTRLQCFDTVGWAASTASRPVKKLSGGMLAW